MKIRKDKYGLYIRSRWGKDGGPAYRPGEFPGYSHYMNTSDGGLKEGDNPKTKHLGGMPFIEINTEDGHKIYWGSYDRAEGDFYETKE